MKTTMENSLFQKTIREMIINKIGLNELIHYDILSVILIQKYQIKIINCQINLTLLITNIAQKQFLVLQWFLSLISYITLQILTVATDVI